MVRMIACLSMLTALAACGGRDAPAADPAANSVGAEQQAKADLLAEVADPSAFKAGRWETKTEVTGVADPSLAAESRREIAGQESAIDQCLPPEETKRPDPNFLAGSDVSECEYERFSMTDGRLTAAMRCTATPGSITVTLAGSYSPTSFALDATASGNGASTDARMTGRWIGACPNEQSQRAPAPAPAR